MNQQEKIEAARASRKKWVQANKEKERERNRRFFKDNPYYAAIRSAKRRALVSSSDDGTITAITVKLLFDYLGNKCLACGDTNITIDHVVPLSLGGRHSIYNIQPLCRSCNCGKRNHSSADYRSLTSEQIDAIIRTCDALVQ